MTNLVFIIGYLIIGILVVRITRRHTDLDDILNDPVMTGITALIWPLFIFGGLLWLIGRMSGADR